jgi:hypothetical protein
MIIFFFILKNIFLEICTVILIFFKNLFPLIFLIYFIQFFYYIQKKFFYFDLFLPSFVQIIRICILLLLGSININLEY